MSFQNNVMKSFSKVKTDMDIVKESFTKAKTDVNDLRYKLEEWQRYFDLRQRELIIEVKELKERVHYLEEKHGESPSKRLKTLSAY